MNILCQAFSQFRSKLAKKTEDEIETLKRNPKAMFELCSEGKLRKMVESLIFKTFNMLICFC